LDNTVGANVHHYDDWVGWVIIQMRNKIFIGILVVAGIIVGFFVSTIFKKKPQKSNYDLLIEAKQETINLLKSQLETERNYKDEIVKLMEKQDSVFVVQYKTNTIKYEKIPVTVANFSDDELRSAVENFR